MAKLPAIILAGGSGERLGGADKALVPLAGKPLIEYVIDRLAPHCITIAINANGDPKRFSHYGLPVVPDGQVDSLGPLAGVLAGLDWAARKGFDAVITAAADTPFFPDTLVDHLSRQAAQNGFAIAATEAGEGEPKMHPTFGLWPVRFRDDLRAALVRHQRRMMQFAESKGAAIATFATDQGRDPFFNINTPDDLAMAQDIISRGG